MRWGAVAPAPAPFAGAAEGMQVTARWVAPPNTIALTNASASPRVLLPARSTVEAGERTFALVAAPPPTSALTTKARPLASGEPLALPPGATVIVTLYPADGVFPAATPLQWGLAIADAPGGAPEALPLKVWPAAERVYVTRASTGERVACYGTAWFYGGSCWFISPSEEDREQVVRRARAELGEGARVEYLDRQ